MKSYLLHNLKMRKGNCSRDSVLYHHLSMPQPDITGKPTPSVYLSCYFLGTNELSFLTYSSKLGLVVANFLQFSPAMVHTPFLKNQIY